MKLQFENPRELDEACKELNRNSVVYEVHVRDKFIMVSKGEVRAETLVWLSSSTHRIKVSVERE